MELTLSQQSAIEDVLEARRHGAKIISLAGPAGTGKTTCMKDLVDRIPAEVAVVTPTNKAVSVLRNKGLPEADTLYSVFFTPFEEPDGKIRFEPNDTVYKGDAPEGKLTFCDTIIVDEASMLQTWLVSHLRRMCNTLILVGDPHQLPPVNDRANPDGYFCTREHDALLSEVLRQGEGSPILELATQIRQGRMPDAMVRQFAPTDTFERWFDGTQKIVAFTNRNRRTINALARRVLGRSGVLPQPGDALVSNTNLSDTVFNGTEATVEEFRWRFDPKKPAYLAGLKLRLADGSSCETLMDMASFLDDLAEGSAPAAIRDAVVRAKVIATQAGEPEGASFSYGYCITGHKSQGSEWPEVCVVDERFVLGKMDPSGQMSRRFNYTVVTRAQEKLVFAPFAWFKNSSARAAA